MEAPRFPVQIGQGEAEKIIKIYIIFYKSVVYEIYYGLKIVFLKMYVGMRAYVCIFRHSSGTPV